MQRFAGLNSIEGWNLTFQLSHLIFTMKNSFPVYEFSTFYGIIEKRLNWREPLFYKESANLVLF